MDAVDSVLGQSHDNVELIAIDNGSTDGSADVMRRYENDERVVLMLHSANEPLTKRQNEGIARSTGDFVSILYADDYYLPQKFERQLARFAGVGRDYGVVYSPGIRLNVLTGEQWVEASMSRSGEMLGAMLTEYHTHNFMNPISPLMRREVVDRFRFRESVFAEGEIIYFRYALSYKFAFLNEPLSVMREHENNIGKAIKRNSTTFMESLELLRREPEFPPHLRPALLRFEVDLLRNYGWQGLRMAEDPAWARQCFSRAIKRDLAQILQPKIAIGTLLSALPRSVLHRLNLAANRWAGHKEIIQSREDYV